MVNSADIMRMRWKAHADAINGSLYEPQRDVGLSPIESAIRKKARAEYLKGL
jgi:hypothetical protein